ncbi:MAG: hypothetical protein WBL79_06810 [Bacillota bacterium]|nr:hypothetical protein [Bacillota bacterium]HPZ14390.1 hypothetical protein [Bacillota bacterium]HQD80388.1 hypothetical protein [Bacillota bacterium]
MCGDMNPFLSLGAIANGVGVESGLIDGAGAAVKIVYKRIRVAGKVGLAMCTLPLLV